ncbi:hypothetical protein [Pedobacter frigidisoli]|uniref:hypothetical protein n=1 Tax=Pedobacter frigidisoli TaxID=2530455 RepID=UPI00292D8B2F|nr:hypothetical protein [Pedobacter frigidisoli]
MTPHYNSQNQIVFYSAWRSANIGIEYIIKASELNKFKENYSTFKAAANLFYLNGKPNRSEIQMANGDYWEGLVASHKEAFTNPLYYLYLAHVFTATATNLKSVPVAERVEIRVSPEVDALKWTSTTIRNTNTVSITIENKTVAQYKELISQKYSSTWQDLGNGKAKLEVGQNRYIYNPAAASTEKPSIYYFRNGKAIGKFRFKN